MPYANDGTVTGASVADNTEWNNVVIGGDAKDIAAVDEHSYPEAVTPRARSRSRSARR